MRGEREEMKERRREERERIEGTGNKMKLRK